MKKVDDGLIDDFEAAWNQMKRVEVTNPMELSEMKLNETTDEYKIADAHAFYMHLTTIINLFYNAKVGEPLFNMFNPMASKVDYNFEFEEE